MIRRSKFEDRKKRTFAVILKWIGLPRDISLGGDSRGARKRPATLIEPYDDGGPEHGQAFIEVQA